MVVVTATASCADDSAKLEAACEAGEAEACFSLGELALRDGARNRARKYLDMGCDLDNAPSCALYGDVSYARHGLDDESYGALAKACRLGDQKSCVNSAWMLYNGAGVATEKGAALERLGHTCNDDFAEGCLVLGLLKQLAGLEESAYLPDLEKACALGDAIACEAVKR